MYKFYTNLILYKQIHLNDKYLIFSVIKTVEDELEATTMTGLKRKAKFFIDVFL